MIRQRRCPSVSPSPMASPASPTVTRLLLDWNGGHDEALEALVPLVYDELRRLAHRHLRGERADHTLSTTALVHEAYFKLIEQDRVAWQNRAHFLAIASQAMRRILLMYARRRRRLKHGGDQERLAIEDVVLLSDQRAEELLALDEALTRLEALDERLARVVEYRYFGGLTVEETAAVLGVSPATIKRDWRTARTWLYGELRT